MNTGPPSTDEIEFPFAGFVHVTVNARSTCQRSRTTLPASSRYCQAVKMPSEWTWTGKPQTPIVLVRLIGVCVTTSGGAARAAGASMSAARMAATRSRKWCSLLEDAVIRSTAVTL